MSIKDIIDKSKHIQLVWIHNHGKSKLTEITELSKKELSYKFEWFEITTYFGKTCIEFNL